MKALKKSGRKGSFKTSTVGAGLRGIFSSSVDRVDKIVGEIKKDKDVVAVALFGSAARNKTMPKSDIDIAVFMKESVRGKTRMGRKRLKYLTGAPDKFDIQIFQLLPLYIRIRILKEGKIIFCRNEAMLYRIAIKNMKDFSLFKPHYETYLEEVSHAR